MSGFSIPSRGSHLTDCLSEGGGALGGRLSSFSTNTNSKSTSITSTSSTNTNSKSTSSTKTSYST